MAKLIVLEGADGAGKSTQVELLKKYLTSKGLTFAFYHFPLYDHNEFSKIIAKFLRGELGKIDEVDPYFIATQYAMERFMFKPDLEVALRTHDVLLLDRYVYSNVAYQSAKMPTEEQAKSISEWILKFEFDFLGLPFPDLNLYFDVPSAISEKRIEASREGSDRAYLQGKQDIHEADLEFQKRVKESYLNSMGNPNCKVVQCAVQIGELDQNQFFVFPPEVLLEMYKPVIDYVLFNTPVK